MKLWHVVQWGNSKEGGNGLDTQCVIAASDLKAAIDKAQAHFKEYAPDYREGLADMVYHLGDDGSPDGEAKLVIRIWIAFADNLGSYDSWHRDIQIQKWIMVFRNEI